jgi:hypothetical protein
MANNELLGLGIPTIERLVFEPIDAAALFWPIAWTMKVNTMTLTGPRGPLTIRQMKEAQIMELVGAVYHEARHAEQRFKIAQYLAGQGKSEVYIRIMSPTSMPVAQKAKAKPLVGISRVLEEMTILLGEELDTRLGMDPKDIAKKTQEYRKKVAANNREVQQAQDWHDEKPLDDLIYDRDNKIRDNLDIIIAEADKRKKGNWDTTKLQPAVKVLKDDVLPRVEQEIKRVSTQKDRSQMMTHLVELKKNLTEIIDFVRQQSSSPSLIPEFSLISLNAQVIKPLLTMAYKELLGEKDAFAQGDKVEAVMKAKAPTKKGAPAKTR